MIEINMIILNLFDGEWWVGIVGYLIVDIEVCLINVEIGKDVL